MFPDKVIPTIRDVLSSGDLYVGRHKIELDVIYSMYDAGVTMDPLIIVDKVRQKIPYSILDYSSVVMDVPPMTKATLLEYCRLIKEIGVRRKTMLWASRFQHDLEYYTDEPTDQLVIEGRQQFENIIFDNRGDTEFTTVENIVPDIREQFENYHKGIATGVTTGMQELDNILDGGGLQPKSMYIIGANEKTGKTSLILGWAYHVASTQNKRVAIITLEMSKEVMTKRLFSTYSNIPFYVFRPGMSDNGPLGPVYSQSVEKLEHFKNVPILIADTLFTIPQIRSKLKQLKDQSLRDGIELGLVCIDYLQIVKNGTTLATGEQEISNISREFKIMSSELDVPIVVISSLNRVGLAEGQEPDVYNLRGSAAIGFDAEAVMLLHNPAYTPGKPYEPRDVTDMILIVARQRNGPTARIPLKFIGKYMQFMTEKKFNRTFQIKDSMEEPLWAD